MPHDVLTKRLSCPNFCIRSPNLCNTTCNVFRDNDPQSTSTDSSSKHTCECGENTFSAARWNSQVGPWQFVRITYVHHLARTRHQAVIGRGTKCSPATCLSQVMAKMYHLICQKLQRQISKGGLSRHEMVANILQLRLDI